MAFSFGNIINGVTSAVKAADAVGNFLGDTATAYNQLPQNNPTPAAVDSNDAYGYAPAVSSGYYAPNGQSYASQDAYNQQTASQINSAYDPVTNYYNSQLSTIDPQQQNAQHSVDTGYDNNLTSLAHSRDAAFGNLDMQQNQINDQYGRGIRDLGNNVRNTLQAQSNRLGTMGASDSSAAPMLAYALATQQNKQRGDMLHDVNNQMSQIANTRNQQQIQFDDKKRELDTWKQGKYSDIKSQFDGLRAQINQALVGNESARRQALANAGQWAAGQVAAVDGTIQQHLSDMSNSFSAAAPNVALGSLPEYHATNVLPGQIGVQQQLGQPVAANNVMQYFAPTYKDPNEPNQF